MGPRAGHDGGRVIFEGAPHALLDADGSLTGRHLAEHLRMVSTDVRSAVLSG